MEKEKTPLISIVIPVYKVEKYIVDTLLSLENQINWNFEIILVDDGSPDDSVEIAERKLRQTQLPFKVIRQKNQGQGVARNVGVNNAAGDWILFLDADDTLQPFATDLYERIVAKNSEADVVFSGYQNVDEQNKFCQSGVDYVWQKISGSELRDGFLTRKRVFLVPGTLYRTDFLKKNAIEHPAIRWSEDQFFMWLVLIQAQYGICLSAIMYNYVHHTGESTMNSTPVDRMLDAYNAYLALPERIADPHVARFLVPRWCLGCLHILGDRKDKAAFECFWQTTAFSKHCRTLLNFPSWKVRILAAAGLVHKGLLYFCLKKRKG